ncbi:uncharacterized protein V6R79_005294 [Siganus canaliculatus]
MMAGVVAMASVIEDFDTQPCKKSRRDDGSPVVKTITNYFSPVPKPAEKPFSPPRSNNIMDYFSRKPPSSKDKTSSPEQSKENCQVSKTNTDTTVKPPSHKRSRKASKTARKLVEVESISATEKESCIIVEEPHDDKDSAAASVVRNCGVLGSDTAALLAQLNAEASVVSGTSETDSTKAVREEIDSKESLNYGNSDDLKPEFNSIELSPILPSKEKAKQVKAASRNSRKKILEADHPDVEEKEMESSLDDASMEVNMDEASQLNNSTVTVSFEEFVRSQSQDKGEDDLKEEESKNTTAAKEMDTDISKTNEKVHSAEPPFQVSPRMVTVQAEVHVSPRQEAKAAGKLASIFNRRKGAISPKEVVASSPPTEIGFHVPSVSGKQKSNVVLLEEDLELAVLESESTPKCSEAERKQFMAAFKQPGIDGSKTKLSKSQGKQKQQGDNALEDADQAAEAVTSLAVEQVAATSKEKKVATKKPARKGRKKANEEKESASTPPPVHGEEDAAVQEKPEEPPITSTPLVPAVRRSRREAVVRQAPEATTGTPLRKTRKHLQTELNVADAAGPASSSSDITAKTSAPKTRKSKHGVFVAEMTCPPDTEQSPIRMKFTRVHRNTNQTTAEGESDANKVLAAKTSNDSKKQKRAKKLVEKAKVIQQSKRATAVEESTVRRSSRAEASVRKSYCENEDSIICLEEVLPASHQVAPEKSKSQKSLRSLNDVLGKAAPPGAKGAPLGQEKMARKASAVISIFDESSREGSENSQDDEQLRARREFLKSGLPESFKKQIAKSAATREAYSLSCSSFQPVIHLKQPPKDCPLWCLLWPDSPFLRHLKEVWCQTSSPLSPVSGPLCVKTKPAHRASFEQGCGWRPDISDDVRQLLVQKVSTSNPSLPVQMLINRLLKRRADYQQQCSASEPEAGSKSISSLFPAEPVGGKRKRMEDDGENTVKVAKKQRGNSSKEKPSPAEPEPAKRRGRPRRSQTAQQDKEAKEKLPASPAEDDCIVVNDNLIMREDTGKKGVKEDALWTDKYQPQHSSDILGNTSSVKRLHSWLKEWKLRADREERKKQKDKQEEGSNDSDWDCGEEDSQDGEDMLCNTMLITGPTGVGKTAAVYACAQELGFKVFEVNASSQRSGRLILSQLKEATQSHQVDSQGVNACKPTFFNSYGTSSSAGSVKPGASPRKVNSPRRVVSSPRKNPQSPRGAKRGGLAPTSLANFFKMGRPTNKEIPNTKQNDKPAASKKVMKANEGNSKKDPAAKTPTTPKDKSTDEPSKKTATSLILFEEVDVIFDDDSGFLAAIKTFMTTTKRPVILTTSDPAFSALFDGSFEEIHFKTPSVLDAGSFLQLLCLAENVRTDLRDVTSMLRLNGCDIRKSLLQMQFWTRSGGGRYENRPLTNRNAELKSEEEASILPPCDTGCTESMLGLLNIHHERNIWELLKSQSTADETFCSELLTNSRRRGVDLLYCNMERLLPLPLTPLTTSASMQKLPVSSSQEHPPALPKEALPSQARLFHTAESEDCSDDGSPVKVSSRMRKTKRRHQLPGQQDSDSDSEDGFVSLSKPQGNSEVKEEVKKSSGSETVKRKPLTPAERLKSLPVSQCLESIADFFDNMSYIDSSLPACPEERKKQEGASQVSAVVKDGMTDESRIEVERESWRRREDFLEIPAAVEALSFNKCLVSASQAWDKAQQLEGELLKEAAAELTLPVAAQCDEYSLTQDGPCQPHLVQRRREVMEHLMFRGVFGTAGGRAAAALDYLPALRTICSSEQLKEQGKIKRRFLHYLDAIHLGLDKSTIRHLAEDFP